MPPGWQITLSPSIRTDSEMPHLMFLPLNSLSVSRAHFSSPPAASKQTSLPIPLYTYTMPSLTVGVVRVPGYFHGPRLLQSGP